MPASTFILPLVALAVAVAVPVWLYDPDSSLALSSGFGLLRSVIIVVSGLMLLFTWGGSTGYLLFAAIVLAFGVYTGIGHASRLGKSTGIGLRELINGGDF